MLKEMLKKTHFMIIAGIALGWLILLDLLPRFTIIMTFMVLVSIIITHIVRKWTKG